MSVLRIDSSIQGPVSASSELADVAEAEWTAVRPGASFVRRHLGASPLPADAWANAIHAKFTPADQRTPAQVEAAALADQLAAEVRDAEAAILALPLYNYGVSQHVKAWIDLVMAGATTPDEKLLDGKPVIVLTTRGGGYGPGTPREGWDHNTAYLRRVVEDIWGGDLTLIERELTLAAVNPAMESLRDTADLLKKAAHEAATHAGRTLASR
ncbi:FMN-dependent NADH-azoreductase [Paractinoplanes abujensis]|uniref:FMN dependent NADH:quinone oxidoreductase n=1 Tax=Paractinoplanes abujensis TaxID=882441 RepID=A0A7W7G3J0_9ACTN|nr:NAD(P)H-dependent oxidoreductase [Actinoplanes abujensis]MBB4694719.1 FMN-dependent NADH-azoreductase [Actinoplanes abujensis]GID20069.1 FMN-dependent NADH-azoreductase [Actinoplanes abujensis]